MALSETEPVLYSHYEAIAMDLPTVLDLERIVVLPLVVLRLVQGRLG